MSKVNTPQWTLQHSRFAVCILLARARVEQSLLVLNEYKEKSKYVSTKLNAVLGALQLVDEELLKLEHEHEWAAFDGDGKALALCESLNQAVRIASQHEQGYVAHETFGV